MGDDMDDLPALMAHFARLGRAKVAALVLKHNHCRLPDGSACVGPETDCTPKNCAAVRSSMKEVVGQTKLLPKQTMSAEDIYLWPDGDWCLAEDFESYSWKSDDYQLVLLGSPEWDALVNEA